MPRRATDASNVRIRGPSVLDPREFNAKHRGKSTFHHTPLHASCSDQMEFFFATVQKRVLTVGGLRYTKECGWKHHGVLREMEFRRMAPVPVDVSWLPDAARSGLSARPTS